MADLPKNTWPKTRSAQHYLFIAQSIRTLLNDNAFESFRVPALDNLMRLRELGEVTDHVLHHELPHTTLNPVISELIHYLTTDETARSILQDAGDEFISLLKSSKLSEFSDVRRIANANKLIHRNLSTYYADRVTADLISVAGSPRLKISAYNLSRNYLAYLINHGYDRRYIRKKADETFFEIPVKQADKRLIRKFTSHFDHKKRDYDVYIPIREKDARAIKRFNELGALLLKPSETPERIQDMIASNDQFSHIDRYFRIPCKAVDPYSAASSVRRVINTYTALSVLEDQGIYVAPRRYSFVKQIRSSKFSVIYDERSNLQTMSAGISASRGRSLGLHLTTIMKNLNEVGRRRVLTAVNGVSLARSSDSSENQISLIWSSIETLFGDPPRGSSRIRYYRDSIIPCIMLNYIWRYSLAVFNQLQIHNRKALGNTLTTAQVDPDLPDLRRFHLFFIDPKYSRFHREFTKSISHNPALLQLVFRYYSTFASPISLRQIFDAHRNRVTWQIDRIYRARNDFVHSGRRPPFVDALSLNAFEYFRTTMQAISYHRLKMKDDFGFNGPIAVDEIVESIRLSYNARTNALTKARLDSNEDAQVYLTLFERK